MSLQQGGRIGAQEGLPILLREAAAAQPGGETVYALSKLAVSILPVTTDPGRFVGKDEGTTVQETHRREFGSIDGNFSGLLTDRGSTKNVRAAIDGEECYSNSPVHIRPHF